MKFENILPKNGPAIKEVSKYIEKYKNDIIVVKIGGSVLLDQKLFDQLIEDISILNKISIDVFNFKSTDMVTTKIASD